jgi:hypothetical protein
MNTQASVNDFADVIEEARRRATDPNELANQRLSFAFGNGNVDADTFSRATMSVVIPPISDSGGTEAATVAPEKFLHRHEAEGALRQADAALSMIARFTGPHAKRFELNTAMIVELHDALREKDEGAGLRKFEVRISGSPLGPPPAEQVRAELDQLCDGIVALWDERDALDLAAQALWRLNWIHPFSDGNGRTARALSYVVLNVKLGGLVPGMPTIPEQLLHRRAEYLDALADADAAWLAGKPDHSALRRLLGGMLERQLGAAPALSYGEIEEIDEVVRRRLGSRITDPTRLFGVNPTWRLWAIGDHVVLQVGPAAAIREAETRLREHDEPFPRLLARDPARATIRIGAGQRGTVVQGGILTADEGGAIGFERNSAATIEWPSVQWSDMAGEHLWSSRGALYVLRFGRELTSAAARDTLDLLLTRHLAGLGR